jgi:RimJ/RimL family protein N-acetyltransferase
MEPVVLETPRLRLDSPVAADQERVFEYCQDPLFERYLTVPWPYTRAHARYFTDRFVPDGWANDKEYTWAIRLRADGDSGSAGSAGAESNAAGTGGPDDAGQGARGELVGVVGFDREHNSIGFWLGAPHRGRGYVPEAATAVVEWIFSLGVTSIGWECVVGNLASASVARQLGFRYTGERDSAAPYRDGFPIASWHAELTPATLGIHQQGWPT